MKRTKTNRADQVAWAAVEALAPQEDQFLIADLDTMRIVADPIRLRILELLVLEAQTAKQLAAILAMPQTKLYYHINLLEERGLIRVVATRVVSGIIEKQYGAVARSFRLDESRLRLGAPERDDTFELMLNSLLEGVKQDAWRALEAGLFDQEERDDDQGQRDDERRVILGRIALRLTSAQAKELNRRIDQLIDEFGCNQEGPAAPDEQRYSMFLAVFPTVGPGEGPERG